MPKYRVLEKSFIDNKLVQAGTTIDFDGGASPNLEPLDAAAEAISAKTAAAQEADLKNKTATSGLKTLLTEALNEVQGKPHGTPPVDESLL